MSSNVFQCLPMFSIAFPMLFNVFQTILIFQCFTILLPSCYHSAISDLGPRFFEHQEIAKYLYFALMWSRALKRCCFSCLYSGCLPIQFQSPAAAASAAAAGFGMESEWNPNISKKSKNAWALCSPSNQKINILLFLHALEPHTYYGVKIILRINLMK